MCTFHLTMERADAVRGLARSVRPVLERFECVDPVPESWLHLTMNGLGFADEVPDDRLEAIADEGATSNFKGYYGYPATVCISVNDVIVHGIPGDYELAPGDIVSFDCGAYVERGGRQWHGDAAFSIIVGETFVSDADFAAGERATGAIAGGGEDPYGGAPPRRAHGHAQRASRRAKVGRSSSPS